jgi:hypothetical protein
MRRGGGIRGVTYGQRTHPGPSEDAAAAAAAMATVAVARAKSVGAPEGLQQLKMT